MQRLLMATLLIFLTESSLAFDSAGELACLKKLTPYSGLVGIRASGTFFLPPANERVDLSKRYLVSTRDPDDAGGIQKLSSDKSTHFEFSIYTERMVYKCAVPKLTANFMGYRLKLGSEEVGIAAGRKHLDTMLFHIDPESTRRSPPVTCQENLKSEPSAKAALRLAINAHLQAVAQPENSFAGKMKEIEEGAARVRKEIATNPKLSEDHRENGKFQVNSKELEFTRNVQTVMQDVFSPCMKYADDKTLAAFPHDLQLSAGMAKILERSEGAASN